MCKQSGYKNGSTMHLLYWQKEWAKRFFRTWYHIIYRKAYWKWCDENCASFIMKRIKEETIDDGLRIELSEITKNIN
jgi:hypothetical protein